MTEGNPFVPGATMVLAERHVTSDRVGVLARLKAVTKRIRGNRKAVSRPSTSAEDESIEALGVPCCSLHDLKGMGDAVLTVLSRCFPGPTKFRWSEHLRESSMRGTYLLHAQTVPRPIGPCVVDVISDGLLHAAVSHAEPAEELSIWLHIYHVRGNFAIKEMNHLTRDLLRLGGIFHSGIEVRGLEWCFGATQDERTGVFCNRPKQCPFHRYRESVYLGTVRMEPYSCLELLQRMASDWCGTDYHILFKNCNHFSLDLASRLGLAAQFPNYLVRLTRAVSQSELPRTTSKPHGQLPVGYDRAEPKAEYGDAALHEHTQRCIPVTPSKT